MASAITVCKMTSMNSSVYANPTMAAFGSNTGLYIDVNNVDASRMILVVTKLASGANSDSSERIRIKASTVDKQFSANELGDLVIEVSSTPHSTKPTGEELTCSFYGPFETARFKDSDGRINIESTNADNIGAIGAILI